MIMNKIAWAVSIWIFFLLGACTGGHGYHVEKAQEVKIAEFTEDIKIPSQAWDLLEFDSAPAAASEGHSASPAGGHSSPQTEGSAGGKNFIFSEITVVIAQKNPGIIKNEAVKIYLPKGGGNIDLAQFVIGKKGTFYVGFEFPDFETATAKRIIFVSGTKKRKIGGQIFGAGCNQYFDVSDKFLKEMKGEGLKVNTTQERYLSVLGGTFLFAAKKDSEIRMAQVTFTNSQFPSLFCKEH